LNSIGVVGRIADARLCDFRELDEYDPAFYCAGETTRPGAAELMPDAANVLAALAGVTVDPGDYVCADSTGTVIIPARNFDEVWAGAKAVTMSETCFGTFDTNFGPQHPAAYDVLRLPFELDGEVVTREIGRVLSILLMSRRRHSISGC
jgi:hypothetical protein